jgi:hypothetical protein
LGKKIIFSFFILMLCLPGAGLANFMPQGKLNNAETSQQSNQISGEKASNYPISD